MGLDEHTNSPGRHPFSASNPNLSSRRRLHDQLRRAPLGVIDLPRPMKASGNFYVGASEFETADRARNLGQDAGRR